MFGRRLLHSQMQVAAQQPTVHTNYSHWIQEPSGTIEVTEQHNVLLTIAHYKYQTAITFPGWPFRRLADAKADATAELRRLNVEHDLFSNAYRYCAKHIIEMKLLPVSEYIAIIYPPPAITPASLLLPSPYTETPTVYLSPEALPLVQHHVWFCIPHPFPHQVSVVPWHAVNLNGERLATLITSAHNQTHVDHNGLNCVTSNLKGGVPFHTPLTSRDLTRAKQTIYHNATAQRWEVWFQHGAIQPKTGLRARHRKVFSYKDKVGNMNTKFILAHEQAEAHLLQLLHLGYEETMKEHIKKQEARKANKAKKKKTRLI